MKSDIQKEAFELYPDYEALHGNDYEHYAMINRERIKLRDAYLKGALRNTEMMSNFGKRLIKRFQLWIDNSGNEDHIYIARKAIKAVKKELVRESSEMENTT